MPRKAITWIGSVVILAVGIFATLALIRYKSGYRVEDTRANVLSVMVFLAPIIALVAISLWYYFNEKVK